VKDSTQDELGATKDGSVKMLIVKAFILSIAICQPKTHAKHTRAPTLALR